jgi:hypothetical protein
MSDHADPNDPQVKPSVQEIQNAHDRFALALAACNKKLADLPDDQYHALCGCLNTLCWLLGHYDSQMEGVLADLDELLDMAMLRYAAQVLETPR